MTNTQLSLQSTCSSVTLVGTLSIFTVTVAIINSGCECRSRFIKLKHTLVVILTAENSDRKQFESRHTMQ